MAGLTVGAPSYRAPFRAADVAMAGSSSSAAASVSGIITLSEPDDPVIGALTVFEATSTGDVDSVVFDVDYGEGYVALGTDESGGPDWSVEAAPTDSGTATLRARAYYGATLVATDTLAITVATLVGALAVLGITGTGAALWIAGTNETLSGGLVSSSRSIIPIAGLGGVGYDLTFPDTYRPTPDANGVTYDPVTETGRNPAWVFSGGQYGECAHADIAATYAGGTVKPWAFFVVGTFTGEATASFGGLQTAATNASGFQIDAYVAAPDEISFIVAGGRKARFEAAKGLMVTGCERVGTDIAAYADGRMLGAVQTSSTVLTADRLYVGVRRSTAGALERFLTGRIAMVGIAPACTNWAALQRLLQRLRYVNTVPRSKALFYFLSDTHCGGTEDVNSYARGTTTRLLCNQSIAVGDPDAVIIPGDMTHGGTAATFNAMFGVSGTLVASGGLGTICDPTWVGALPPLIPVMGNHDAYYPTGGEADINYATYADAVLTGAAGVREAGWYFTKAVSGIRFYSINTSSFDATQNSWLGAQLAANSETWQLVVEHRPPYHLSSYNESYYPLGDLLPMVKTCEDAGNVRLVIHGHLHRPYATQRLTLGAVDNVNGISYLGMAGCGTDVASVETPGDYDTVNVEMPRTDTITLPDELDFITELADYNTGAFQLVFGSADSALTFEWWGFEGSNAVGYSPVLLYTRTYDPIS